MGRISTKKIVLNGLMIALVFLATRFTSIPGPIPPGYFNLGDVVIIVAAVLFGKNTGFLAGAIGSCLADISCGAFIYAPVTFIVKGLEGYVIGAIAFPKGEKKIGEILTIATLILGAAIMVGGYFAAELFLLKYFDATFGYVAAITDLPLNLVQGGFSVVLGYLMVILIEKVKLRKYVLG